jgi:hypothetical protein
MNHLFQSEDIDSVGDTLLRGSILAILSGFLFFFVVPQFAVWLLSFLPETGR